MNGVVLLTVKAERGDLVTYECQIVDVSEKGIGIESPHPVLQDADAHLQFMGDSLTSFACVRYCQERDSVYRLGLFFV